MPPGSQPRRDQNPLTEHHVLRWGVTLVAGRVANSGSAMVSRSISAWTEDRRPAYIRRLAATDLHDVRPGAVVTPWRSISDRQMNNAFAEALRAS